MGKFLKGHKGYIWNKGLHMWANRSHPKGMLGKHHSEETCRKIGEAGKGRYPSEETRRKLCVAQQNRPPISEETRKKMSEARMGCVSWMKGKHHSLEARKKLSNSKKGEKNPRYGKHHSWETRQKMGDSQRGEKNHFFGKHLSAEHKRKLSEATKGEKSWCWKGGISFEPYTTDWTKTLKRSIRERDHYVCQLCGALQSDEAFCVHHKDYMKSNSSPNNLITLCRKCHLKTNLNREYWKAYFNCGKINE